MRFGKLVIGMIMMSALSACDGDDGKDGIQGPQGPQGDTGPQGAQGESAPSSKAIDLTILHMNDHHSHIAADEFDFDVTDLTLSTTKESGDAIDEVEVVFGGFPMLVSLFNTLESQHDNVLKLHAGDAITGTLYYSLFNGAADAAVMNQICFDAFSLGNHEFDDGDTGLANFLDALNSTACNTPALAANIVPANNSAIASDYIKAYTIKEFDGEKVGIIGIDIAGKTKNSSNPDDATQFLDETTTAQANIDKLTEMGINKIILMTHYQYFNDLKLAAALDGVDIIVGGDSHTLLGDDTFTDLGFHASAEYPTVVTDAKGKTVCIVQAWEYAHLMGKLQVSFDAAGDVTACQGHPYMPIDGQNFVYKYADGDERKLNSTDQSTVVKALTAHPEIVVAQPDATTLNLLNTFNEQVSVLEQTVIGTTTQDLCLERFPGQGRSTVCEVSATYIQGSDISNIVAKAFLTVTPTADIAIQNGGGVRVDIAAGNFTIADAFTLLPFSNTLVTLDMTGQQIIDVLEEALANTLDNNGSSGSYPYASGLRFEVDASQEAGNRISNVEVNSRVSGDWAAININTVYTVVTNDFIASGRDGYKTFGVVYDAGNYVDTFTEYAQGFIDYVKGLTSSGQALQKLPMSEYSTQSYTDTAGCDHSVNSTCGDNDSL